MVELNQFNVFKTVLYYSIFILLAPIGTFFSAKYLFFEGKVLIYFHFLYIINYNRFIFLGFFGISNVASNVWSAVAAVAVLHVALGCYIYKAYSNAEQVKQDKTD